MISLGQKLKMPKTILQEEQCCSGQKTARKSTKYWRNETILKIGHLAKAIAHAKAIAFANWSVWIKNYKCQNYAKNLSTSTSNLFCAKKSAEKKKQLFQ